MHHNNIINTKQLISVIKIYILLYRDYLKRKINKTMLCIYSRKTKTKTTLETFKRFQVISLLLSYFCDISVKEIKKKTNPIHKYTHLLTKCYELRKSLKKIKQW